MGEKVVNVMEKVKELEEGVVVIDDLEVVLEKRV